MLERTAHHELHDIGYHVRDGILTIHQAITQPENIDRIAEYVSQQGIYVVSCQRVSSACFASVIALINQCKQLRSLEINFSEKVDINQPMIDAIKEHQHLFRLVIKNMQLEIINSDELSNLKRRFEKEWVKFDLTGCKYNSDKDKLRAKLSRDYIAANQELFSSLAILDVYQNLWQLFTAPSLAILEFPDLALPRCPNGVGRNFWGYDNDQVIFTYFEMLPLKKYAEKIYDSYRKSNRLCLVTVANAEYKDRTYQRLTFKDKDHEHVTGVFAKLLEEARNHFTEFDLLDAKEKVDYLQWLSDALVQFNKTIEHDFQRFPVPRDTEFKKLQKDIQLFLDAQDDFADVGKRHSVFKEIWQKRLKESSCQLFLINLLISADPNQLPFLAEPYFKYLLLMALLQSMNAGKGDGTYLALQRHAYHNAIRLALNPTVASDEMTQGVEGESVECYGFEQCVFYCTLGRWLQQVSARLSDVDLPVLARPFQAALQHFPCDLDMAKKLFEQLSQPEVLPYLKECEEYSHQMFGLLQAFLQPQRKQDLFITVKEQIFKSIQSWLDDPIRFEKNKLKQQERLEALRMQKEQIMLLRQQVSLLKDIKQKLDGQDAALQAQPEVVKDAVRLASFFK